MIDFNGWEMPIHYGSQLEEHKLVRGSCGIFDVSHMTILDIEGSEDKKFLRSLLSNDITSLQENYDGLYSAMLNDGGGVIDDLTAFKMPFGYRLVVNCATRKTDLKWIHENSERKSLTIEEREDLAMIAIQGPWTFKILSKFLSSELMANLTTKQPFQGCTDRDTLVTKTGYTGEIGVEIMLPSKKARALWAKAIDSGAYPTGLAARDTLRLEAGMNLYGSEMDETISPLECNMSWVVSLKDEDRNFIGKQSFLKKREKGDFHTLKGLVFKERSIARSHQEVYFDEEKEIKGVVTSGSYSPTLKKSIALARIPPTHLRTCVAEIRGKTIKATVGQPRFVRKGKNIFKNNI